MCADIEAPIPLAPGENLPCSFEWAAKVPVPGPVVSNRANAAAL